MAEKVKQDDNAKLGVILCAAQKRFAKFGLAKTTMNEIAADVGMGKASLYYYFPDKETLFHAVITKEVAEFMAELNKILESKIEASVQLKQYVKIRNSLFKSLLNVSKLRAECFFSSKPVFGKALDEFHNHEIDFIKTIIQNGITTKEFRKINKQDYADLLIHLMAGLRLVRIKHKDVADLEENDFDLLDKETSKVVSMFIKEIQATGL